MVLISKRLWVVHSRPAIDTCATSVYNSLRQLTNVQDSVGLYTMSYDLLDRLLTTNAPGHPNGLPVSYGYDENSNRTTMGTPWGLFTYGFDPRDQMQTMADPGYPAAAVPGGITTWTHDARMLAIRQDNVNLTRTTTTYDADRRMTQQWHFTAASAAINYAALVYDAADRPLTRATQAGISTFGYDLCDRVLTEWDPINGRATFGYDLAGRRVNMQTPAGKYSYNYDIADQMLIQYAPTGSVSYNHDANGSTTGVISATARTTYQWDAANRLSVAILPAAGGRYTQAYRYDDMRISESSPAGIATMIWSGQGQMSGSGSGNATTTSSVSLAQCPQAVSIPCNKSSRTPAAREVKTPRLALTPA